MLNGEILLKVDLKEMEPEEWDIDPIDCEVDLERELWSTLDDLEIARVESEEYKTKFNKVERITVELKA